MADAASMSCCARIMLARSGCGAPAGGLTKQAEMLEQRSSDDAPPTAEGKLLTASAALALPAAADAPQTPLPRTPAGSSGS